MTIQQLWDDFNKLDLQEQVVILKEYASYITEYPENHDSGSYPVCLLEWWTNDYLEGDK